MYLKGTVEEKWKTEKMKKRGKCLNLSILEVYQDH